MTESQVWGSKTLQIGDEGGISARSSVELVLPPEEGLLPPVDQCQSPLG